MKKSGEEGGGGGYDNYELNRTENKRGSISQIVRKISGFLNNFAFFKPEAPKVIHHLGGINIASSDGSGTQSPLNRRLYTFEDVPINTKSGEVFIYGNVIKPHIKDWMKKTESGETTLNFQDFLTEKMSQEPELEGSLLGQQVRYFNNKDREQTKIKILNGNLMQIGLDSTTTELKSLVPGNYAFVIADVKDASGNINRTFYATPKVKTANGKIQHSGFVRGGNVVTSGMLTINDKEKIIGIRNESGHYQPTSKDLAHLVKHLQDSGFDTSKIYITCYKSQLGMFINNQFNLKWGIVEQRADLWFEETGRKLVD